MVTILQNHLNLKGISIVNGILCSCYASFDHYLSHTALAPIRMFPSLLDDTLSQHKEGIRPVVKWLKQLGTFLGMRMKTTENGNMIDMLPIKEMTKIEDTIKEDL